MADTSHIFGTPLIIADLSDAATLLATLRELVSERRKSHPSAAPNWAGVSWQSDARMIDWGGGAAASLASAVIELAGQHTIDTRNGDRPRFAWVSEMWAEVLGAGDYRQLHCQAGAFWSAICIVDDGYLGSSDRQLGGEIEIEDPRMPGVIMEAPDFRIRVRPNGPPAEPHALFRPASQRLLLFPGWLRRAVRPFSGPGERILVEMKLVAVPLD